MKTPCGSYSRPRRGPKPPNGLRGGYPRAGAFLRLLDPSGLALGVISCKTDITGVRNSVGAAQADRYRMKRAAGQICPRSRQPYPTCVESLR